MKRARIILLLLICGSQLQAQSVSSLKQCIAYGLQHHISRQVYANEKLSARSKSREARAGYLPSVNVNGGIDDNLKVQESVIPAGTFGPTELRVAFTKKFAATGSAQLDQTLYDQSLITGLKANKYNLRQADLNEQLNDETIVYNICVAYYQIFVYKVQLSLLQANLQSYDEQLRISRLSVEKGVATEADLNKIQVNYNNTYSQIITAETNLRVSENQLKRNMGFPLDQTFAIDSLDSGDHQQRFLSAVNTNAFSTELLTDVKLSQVDIQLLEIDQRRIRAGALPKLTAYARYGGNGFGDNLGQAFSTVSEFSAIGLKLNIPLFDGLKRNAQYTQARLKTVNARKNLELDKQEYNLGYQNNRTKLVQAKRSMDMDESNIRLAQSVFKSTDLQYQKGVTGLTDWLNAQSALKEAQTNYLNSLYDFYLAGIDLEKAKGTLIQFYNAL
jgi:outer membrane protein